jgi:hypothetical protein
VGLSLNRGILFDLLDEARDVSPVGLGGEMFPAGERRQGERLGLGEAFRIGLLPFDLREMLLCPVVQGALAEKLGLNVSTMVAWERDRVRKLFPKVRRRFEAWRRSQSALGAASLWMRSNAPRRHAGLYAS